MAEKVELTKNDDIEDIKGAIKCINALMKSFADNMKKLHRRMDSLEEDMDMVEILGAEMSKLRKTVADMQKSEESSIYSCLEKKIEGKKKD